MSLAAQYFLKWQHEQVLNIKILFFFSFAEVYCKRLLELGSVECNDQHGQVCQFRNLIPCCKMLVLQFPSEKSTSAFVLSKDALECALPYLQVVVAMVQTCRTGV